MSTATRTIEDVRSEFARKGLSFAEWALKHGLRPPVVYDLINGRTVGNRGQAHNAAVLLGLKEGEVDNQRQPAGGQ